MSKRVVILGGGTGGTLTANRLRRVYLGGGDGHHSHRPGRSPRLPTGSALRPLRAGPPEDIVRPRGRQIHDGIGYVKARSTTSISRPTRSTLEDGSSLGYDVLVVATGAVLVPEETEGLTGAGWMEKVFTFYSLEGAAALEAALATFDGGRVVVNVVDMPIKCPVAPLEFCFLADWYFQERGIRDRVATDLRDTSGRCLHQAGGVRSARRDAGRQGHRARDRVQHGRGRRERTASSSRYDGREVGFDLAVVIPLHGGAAYVGRSPGLGDELNFVPTDEHTLQSKAAPNVFVIGDAAECPGFEGRVGHPFRGRGPGRERPPLSWQAEPLDPSFDGHTNCFIETGFHKALLIDFNYDTEPLPGHYPSERRAAVAERVPAQPSRQAHVPVVLLARPCCRAETFPASARPCPPPGKMPAHS